jgi:type II secretory pathway component PulK
MPEMNAYRFKNNRGVALIIVLLVTALLIALIFEFAYGTRVSLRGAANFRDSQRAYFLARSGVKAFVRYEELRDLIPQGQWGIMPIISSGDTEVRIKWEDESGKIMITDIKTNPNTQALVKNLFEVQKIDTAVYDKMVDTESAVNRMTLLTELHQYMSDDDFIKVRDCLTVSPVNQIGQRYININHASAAVLRALGIGSETAQRIIEERNQDPYTDKTLSSAVDGIMVPNLSSTAAGNFLTATPGAIYTVFANATIGGYTKQIEAVVNLKSMSLAYWKVQ